jgi:hypothetical protein
MSEFVKNYVTLSNVIIMLLVIGIIILFNVKNKNNNENFCTCLGLGNKSCRDPDEMRRLYNEGILTEFTIPNLRERN